MIVRLKSASAQAASYHAPREAAQMGVKHLAAQRPAPVQTA